MSFDDVMKDLRAQYIQELPAKISLIEKHLANDDWESLHVEFHKLKGTGKTYGYPEISELCMYLEDICRFAGAGNGEFVLAAIKVLKKILEAYNTKSTFLMSSDEDYLRIRKHPLSQLAADKRHRV